MVCPISKSAAKARQAFLRDGGIQILQERFAQYAAVAAVGEVACRSIASLSQDTECAKKMAELGTVKTLIEAINAHYPTLSFPFNAMGFPN